MSTSKKYISRSEASKLLKRSVKSIDRYIEKGILRSEKRSNKVFILYQDIEKISENIIDNNNGVDFRITNQKKEITPDTIVSNISNKNDLVKIMETKVDDYNLHIKFLQNAFTNSQNEITEQRKKMESAHFKIGELEERVKHMVPIVTLQNREIEISKIEKKLIESNIRASQAERKMIFGILFFSIFSFILIIIAFFS